MGRSNWMSSSNGRECKYIYIEQNLEDYIDPELSQEEREDRINKGLDWEQEYWLNDFLTELESILPKSFVVIHEKEKWEYYTDDSGIIASNGLFQILIADNQSSIAIAIMTKEDAPHFADVKCAKLAKNVFDKLWDVYTNNLYVCTGPWTSGLYIPTWLQGASIYNVGKDLFLIEKSGCEPVLLQQIYDECVSVRLNVNSISL